MPELQILRKFFIALLVVLVACGESLTSEELLARSQVAFDAGEYDAATIDAKAALQQNPRSAPGRRLLGDIAMARASYAEAASEYEKALSFDSNAPISADYMTALVEGGQFRKILDEALDGRFAGLESNAIILAGLSTAEASTGNQQRARELLAQAKESTADHPFVRLAEVRFLSGSEGDIEAAKLKAQALAADYPEYAPGFSVLGDIQSLERDYEASAVSYAEAARLNPLRLRDRFSLVGALMSTGDTEAARTEIAGLNQLVSRNPILKFYQGRLALSDGLIEEGLNRLDETLADIPNHPGALYFAGLANLEQGNLATAERQLSTFLSQNPEHFEAKLALGRLYLQNTEAPRAQAMANRILDEFPGSVAALRILAAAMSMQGQHAESAEVYATLAQATETPDVRTLVRYGAELVRSGNTDGIAELEKARDLDPLNEQSRRLLVASYLAKGELDNARAEVASYRSAASDSAVPAILAGQLALFENDFEGAAKAFDEALSIDPQAQEALRGKAGIALRDGDVDAAAKVFEGALDSSPESFQSLMALAVLQERQGDSSAMVSTLQRAIEVDPDALSPRIALARQTMRDGQYGDGIALLTEVRDIHEESPELHELLAGGFLALREMDSAVAASERVLELRPNDLKSLRLAAVTAEADQKFDRAESYILRALEIAPEDVESRRRLVELYIFQKKYDELAELLESLPAATLQQRDVQLSRGRVELLRSNPEGALGLLRAAHAQAADSQSVFLLTSALLQNGSDDEAEEISERWLEENPDDPVVLQQYSTYLLARGRDADGAKYLSRIYEKAPDNVVVLNNLAWAYRKTNTSKAIELANSAVKLAPENMSIVDTRSVVLFEAGQFEDALADNDKALELAPGFPQVLFHRAQILDKMGRDVEAIRALERVENVRFAEQLQAQELLKAIKARS